MCTPSHVLLSFIPPPSILGFFHIKHASNPFLGSLLAFYRRCMQSWACVQLFSPKRVAVLMVQAQKSGERRHEAVFCHNTFGKLRKRVHCCRSGEYLEVHFPTFVGSGFAYVWRTAAQALKITEVGTGARRPRARKSKILAG